MVDLKKSSFRFPVSRVKLRSPDGHSGHRRLQAVVGSIDTVIGTPHCTGRLKIFVSWYDVNSAKTFTARLNVILFKNRTVSWI